MENKHLSNFIGGGFWQVSKQMVKAFGISEAVWFTYLFDYRMWLIKENKIADDDYFYISQEKIFKDTGISIDLQTQYIKNFLNRGFLLKEKKGLPARNHYYINSISMIQYLQEINFPYESANQQVPVEYGDKTSGNTGTYNNKVTVINEFKYAVPKGTDEPEGSSPEREDLLSNMILRPIKISPYRNFTEQAKRIFLYWNSKGKPLTKHKENSGAFKKALIDLDLLIRRGYSEEEIKKSIDNYYWLITWKDFIQAGHDKSGTIIGLNQFTGFGPNTKDRIKKFNPDLIKNNVTSWFEECLNTREVLEQKWSKMVKDEYPQETKKLKELWEEFGGRKLDPVNDENIFRRLSIRAHEFFIKLNGKYQWGMMERYPLQRLHHLFDCLQAEGQNWRKAQPSYLLNPKMFTEKLPAHWERIALADALTEEERRQLFEGDHMEISSHFCTDPNSSREKTLAIIAAQHATRESEPLQDYGDADFD
ncbi:hypothetical protein KKH23_10100 [Patescibacteria group bacterium]|uniref:Uncharacterized protein n=1 Tax=viral metagenome TaxID=1070528 RepID=A0A6M3MFW1_9ZZZZ|nr:hypothetical protein [Patescibacteria group bacterium]MBU0847524.1 hypothetical protein [Patescibacteria group bacterium]